MTAKDSYAHPTVMTSEISLRPSWPEAQPYLFRRGFTIGRDESCGLRIDSPPASRFHAAVSLEEGEWWACDLASTNGVYVNGKKVERERLATGDVLKIGQGGVQFQVSMSVSGGDVAVEDSSGLRQDGIEGPAGMYERAAPPKSAADHSERASEQSSPTGASPPQPPIRESPTTLIRRYFEEGGDETPGEHTRMIRLAYQRAKTRDSRPWAVGLGVLAIALIGTAAGLLWQRARLSGMEEQAAELFTDMRNDAVALAQLRTAVEEQGGADLQAQLRALEARQRQRRLDYEGYVEKLSRR